MHLLNCPNWFKKPQTERGCVVLDQPQQRGRRTIPNPRPLALPRVLRLVEDDTAVLRSTMLLVWFLFAALLNAHAAPRVLVIGCDGFGSLGFTPNNTPVLHRLMQ